MKELHRRSGFHVAFSNAEAQAAVEWVLSVVILFPRQDLTTLVSPLQVPHPARQVEQQGQAREGDQALMRGPQGRHQRQVQVREDLCPDQGPAQEPAPAADARRPQGKSFPLPLIPPLPPPLL